MNQYQRQEKEDKRTRPSGPSNGPSKPNKCPACGTICEPGDAFCSECGEPLGQSGPAAVQTQEEQQQRVQQQQPTGHGRQCPNCHKAINDTCEICPHCGKPIDDSYCIFCGAPYEGNELFCGECGSPRSGIKCPQCGTLSFRSFCCHCNAPLNDNALAALELAKKDPKFKRVQQLYQEMASMEAYLEAFKQEIEEAIAEEEMEADGPDAPGLSAEGQQLQEKYAELLKLMGQAAAPRPKQQPATKPSVKKREQLKKKFVDASKIMEAYQAKAAEMQAAMAEMIPDVSMTPQQQRDYACARKIAVDTKFTKRVPEYWECNYCHCYHFQPSECAEPQLGGTWHYKTVTVTNRVWKYMD